MLVYSYVAGKGVELTVHKQSVVVEKIKEVLNCDLAARNCLRQKL